MLALGLVQVNKQSNDPRLSKNSFLGSLACRGSQPFWSFYASLPRGVLERRRNALAVSVLRFCWNSVTQLVTVPTISRAASLAELTFGLTTGLLFSPFLTIRIVFFSDIALFSGIALNSYFISTKSPPLSSQILYLERLTPLILQRIGHIS